jgi:hypothetical protein
MPSRTCTAEGKRAKILAQLRAAGAHGASAPDFLHLFPHRRVKDGFDARRAAGAAGLLGTMAKQGLVVRVTQPGRFALYAITGAGLDWLEAREALARGAAATGRIARSASSVELDAAPEAPPQGLFD